MVFRSWKMSGMMNGSTSSSRMAEISKTMRKNSSRDMRKNDITDVYLRLLTSGERNPPREDWEAAWDLCEKGYASAHKTRSAETAACPVDLMQNFQPTLDGLQYAQELATQKRRSALWRRLIPMLAGLVGVLAGIATIASYLRGG